MLNFTKGNTETILFTATELATIPDPFFLFIFTSRESGEVVKLMADNDSTTGRYDSYEFVVNDYFEDSNTGIWIYEVRQKADDQDFTITGLVVEQGFMTLNPATAVEPAVYYQGQDDTFKTYNG